MKMIETKINGVFLIDNYFASDNRGIFIKSFNKNLFDSNGLDSEFKENYFSFSKKGVIRGMHFQVPPFDQAKLVTVVEGSIIDVILDLRKDSPTYLKFIDIKLSRENNKSVYIPKGLAHGFGVISEKAILNYLVTSEYNSMYDKGVNYNSIGFRWPIENPIISKRDENLLDLNQFKSPF